MGNARVYLFSMPEGHTGYIPAVPVIKDYFRPERRKADNALTEFLTLTYLNGIAKHRPNEVNTIDPASERERVKDRIFDVLDTRNEPLRHDPEGLLARKARGLAAFCVSPTVSELEAILRLYEVEDTFVIDTVFVDDDSEEYASDDDARFF